VNDAQRFESQAVSLQEVLLDYSFDISWRDGVEVENIGYGNPDRFFFHGSFEYRAESKSPASRSGPGLRLLRYAHPTSSDLL
jgi:hypothetical protein